MRVAKNPILRLSPLLPIEDVSTAYAIRRAGTMSEKLTMASSWDNMFQYQVKKQFNIFRSYQMDQREAFQYLQTVDVCLVLCHW